VQRVRDEIAQEQVSKGKAKFIPKHEWKEYKSQQAVGSVGA
jgi:hypothetical protein